MTDQFKRGNLSARFRQMAADQPRKTAAMTDQTQILDVTYGMFSCRLEGFDDSVATMKQIVSYFHDLAGHEAFMGDALLAPDMEEVSRVAGASSGGDVEASMAGGKLHLRLRDTPAQSADEDAADAAFDQESVAAKLDRIRSVVGRGHVTETTNRPTADQAEKDGVAPQSGVNPLAQRLAALAKRNAERAATQAGFAPLQDAPEIMDDATSADVVTALPSENQTSDESLHLANLVADDGLDLHAEVAEIERVIEDRKKRHALSDNAEDSISRILSHTDAALNRPEHRRQQDAFAQLKAAVAATEAARQLGDDGATQHRPSEVYRDDLDEFETVEDTGDANMVADAVNPNPDAVNAPRSPATLRLVASQRADVPADPASQRLRQIAAKATDAGPRLIGFAEFAADYAATSLEDLIEAAAAYITFMLDEDDFSRPQVMKLVQSLTQTEISREDGLRCFGRLLRQNRIIKLDNGRFQVAGDTRFRPDDLSARG